MKVAYRIVADDNIPTGWRLIPRGGDRPTHARTAPVKTKDELVSTESERKQQEQEQEQQEQERRPPRSWYGVSAMAKWFPVHLATYDGLAQEGVRLSLLAESFDSLSMRIDEHGRLPPSIALEEAAYQLEKSSERLWELARGVSELRRNSKTE